MTFVHLHRHSEWSLLDGLGTSEMYAKQAAELEQPALAITDHGTLSGVLYHVESCAEVGIKAIVGMEAYFRPEIQADRDSKNRFGYTHLVLLAKNLEGFHNLMRLSSLSYDDDHFYQKPNIDWTALRNHSGGLIASSSCVNGLMPQMIIRGEDPSIYMRVMQDIFGDDFYLEIQPHDFDEQRLVNHHLADIAFSHGIPLVAAIDAHYPFKDWVDTQQVMFDMRKKGDEESMTAYPTCWLTSKDEVLNLFDEHDLVPSQVDEAIKNTLVMADRCEHLKIDKSPKIPKATKSKLEAERVLREWCNEGLERIGKTNDATYVDRVEEEIAVMRKLGVLDYFVIVGDMVRWAKDQGIRVGPGRGSAAGCLVNYLIRITAIDPIGYNLLFERFLNEYRTEIPDIDIDFQHDRRDEVKQYLIDKWGADHVVDIAAFQSFGFKGVIKDVCRALGISYGEAENATKGIPEPAKLFGVEFEELEEMVPEVKAIFAKYPILKKHCYRLHGQMKGQSVHAAAVIVTDKPAADLIPMMRTKNGGQATQWSERANAQLISPYGFLKIDMLVTDALTTQANCIRLIKERHGVDIDFEDPKQFPVMENPLLSEPEVARSFIDGMNLGVFQFGSGGILGTLRDIIPENLEHLIAANALHRPGTLVNGVTEEYARRKNGMVGWKLPHPSMEEFVGSTFGLMIYQEQVMQIFRVLGKDVEPSAAAVFLKVVAKGIARDLEGKAKLQKYYDIFEAGCVEKGMQKSSIDEIWSQILQMTTYSFNRSHAAGYALQAYQDKWLKEHYPLEFYACLLSTETDKVPQIIRESKIKGVKILSPDINTSDTDFTIDGNAIRFGLLAISYVGDSAIQVIKDKRPFETYTDFYERTPKQKVNKRVKKALFAAGAFDSLGARDDWILDDEAFAAEGSMTDQQKAYGEKEYLGFIVSRKSEFDQYKDLIKDRIWAKIELDELDNDTDVVVGGEITSVKEHTDSKGHTMAFVKVNFGADEYECTFFAGKYDECRHFLVDGGAILVAGEWQPDRKSVLVGSAITAAQLEKELKKEMSYAS